MKEGGFLGPRERARARGSANGRNRQKWVDSFARKAHEAYPPPLGWSKIYTYWPKTVGYRVRHSDRR